MLDEMTLAAPSYLAARGTPLHPRSLDGHHMIGFQSSATGGQLPLEFMIDGNVHEVTLPTTISVNAAESYLTAAEQGLGLIQIPWSRFSRIFHRPACPFQSSIHAIASSRRACACSSIGSAGFSANTRRPSFVGPDILRAQWFSVARNKEICLCQQVTTPRGMCSHRLWATTLP
jgi:hypothetical protein